MTTAAVSQPVSPLAVASPQTATERHPGLDAGRIVLAAALGILVTLRELPSPASTALVEVTNALTAGPFVLAGVALGLRYGSSAIPYGDYIARRLLRIVPLLLLVSLLLAYSDRSQFSFGGWLEAMLTWGYSPGPVLGREGSLAAPGWLLGPLLQLYLVFPFIHRFAWTRGARWMAGLLATPMICRMVALVWAGPDELAGWTTLGHIDAFVLGYLATHVWRTGRRVGTIATVGLLLGAAGLAVPVWRPGIGTLAAYDVLRPTLLGLVGSALALGLLEVGTRRTWRLGGRIAPVLLAAQLFWLPVLDGVRHRGLFRFASAPVPDLLLNATLVVLPLALGIGAVTRAAFELPIRRKILAMLDSRVREHPALIAKPASAQSRNIGHLEGLDHLRALAALLVFAYHSHEAGGGAVGPGQCQGPLWSLILEGYNGVGLFMVLSGFVFSHGAHGRTVRYGAFLYNRLLRVYPLYLWLLLVAASSFRTLVSGAAIFQSLLALGNLPGAASVGNTVASAAWTLSPEFQFYLLFPLLHQALEDRRAKAWLGAVFASLLAFRWLAYSRGGDLQGLMYLSVFGRLMQFMVGMLAARAYHRFGSRPLLFPIGVALVLMLHQVERGLGGFFATPALWVASRDLLLALAWALLLLGYLPLGRRLPRALARPLTHVGTISYSLYLLHYSLMATFNHHQWVVQFVRDPHWNTLIVFAAIQLPLVVLIATVTFNVIERPFLEMRVRYLGERG